MCLFCKIVNKEIPSKTIYEDEDFLAFLDINPSKCGHTLVVPKKHFEDIYNIDNECLIDLINKGKELYKMLESKLNCDGCSYVINYGSCQEVKHIHLHIIPNYNIDINMSLDEVYDKIKK